MNEVTISCTYNDRTERGSVKRRDLSHAERVVRSLKMLGIFWGIAIMTVFIPLLHFVLVPLFFLLGLFVSISTAMQKSLVVSGQCSCPNCEKTFQLGQSVENWPKTYRCPSCFVTLEISDDSVRSE